MGKVRRQRRKLHLEAKTKREFYDSTQSEKTPELLIKPDENLFHGLQINFDSLNKNVSDDVRSVKSYKSVKSEASKTLSKKEKLKLRREMLMKKFDVTKQQKKKKETVVGDMNPLRDALPSLESLLKSRGNVHYKQNPQPKKKKGIEKSKKLKKNHLQGIKMFQQIFKNKRFQKNPQEAISQHLKAILDHEKS